MLFYGSVLAGNGRLLFHFAIRRPAQGGSLRNAAFIHAVLCGVPGGKGCFRFPRLGFCFAGFCPTVQTAVPACRIILHDSGIRGLCR